MGETNISWTDRTWNPVVGCTKVSPGCANCYAKTLHDKRHKAYLAGKDVPQQYGVPFEQVQMKPERLGYPLGWQKPQRIFVNSVSDLFHNDVPFDFVDEVFAVMMLADRHVFQILTKRPELQLAYMTTPGRFVKVMEALERLFSGQRIQRPKERGYIRDWPFRNVWLGTSVENQHWADIRIPLLAQTPAAVRFLSCEPLLGSVDLARVPGYPLAIYREAPMVTERMMPSGLTYPPRPGRGWVKISRKPDIHWVIVGGESGPKRRAMAPEWARSLRDQCLEAGVAYFYKQDGGARSETGKELDGQRWEQMPEVAG